MRVRQEHISHPDATFRFLRFETDRLAGGPHRHPQLELTWIERGSGMRLVGDSVEPFADGDLVLLGGQLPHAWLGEAGPRTAVASVLQFPPRLFEPPALPELEGIRPLAAAARLGLAIGGETAHDVREVLRALGPERPLGRLVLFLRIVEALTAGHSDLRRIADSAMGADRPGRDERRIDRVTDWVSRHLGRDFTVAEVAPLAGVSPAAFSRFFRREAGKSFSVYVNDARLSAACLQLGRSDRPIASIAGDCGFASLSHFNRQFRRRFGMTPGAYRRGHRHGP